MSSAFGRQRGRQALSPRVAAPNRRNSILKKELTTPEKENTGNHAGAGSNPRGKKSSSKGDKKRRVSFSATIDVLKFDARKFDVAPSKIEVAKTKLAPVPRCALNAGGFLRVHCDAVQSLVCVHTALTTPRSCASRAGLRF